MYNKVVVPLDGSELAEGVLPYIAALTQARGGQVFLLSIAHTARGALWPFSDLQPGAEQQQRIRQELEKYLQAAAKKLEASSAEVQFRVRFGRPADEILTFAEEIDADLIATSTHGRSGIGQWVFGRVTDRLLRGATCPVLLVRAGQARSPATYHNILVPLDGSEMAEQVLPYVKALIQPNHTCVFLISILMTGLSDRTVALLTSYPPGLQLATTALHHAEIQSRSYLRSVAAVLRERGAAVRIAVRQGSPADEILDYAAEIEADLIGMTTHGLSGPSRWVYGNVAGKVLQGTRSPVLLVRPKELS
jgi:nucleotide-binding universal stress UspA family protein